MAFTRIILLGLLLFGFATDGRRLAHRELAVDRILAELQVIRASDNGRPYCRQICGSCGSACSSTTGSKRSLSGPVAFNITDDNGLSTEYENTGPLLKRVIRPVRQNNVGNYIKTKAAALVSTRVNPRTNLISLAYSTNRNDFTFAVLRDLQDFKTNVLNIGVVNLTGCTVLTVVSHRAVYMGHFFENLAFAPDAGNPRDPDTAFQENCLNLITGQGQTYQVRGDSLDPRLFTGENGPAFAFIMTPRQSQDSPTEQNPNPPVPGPETQMYAGRINQLSQTLTDLIPGLWIVYYNYIAVDTDEYIQDYQGKALYEYDPNADGANNANFRLWYEQNTENGQNLGLVA
ncbi:hypothetical protein F5Y11DRAFT_343630 [Daldinia sp. FL1419]|nr:hypothetical protein F5Y11DRAFT_343630 [Daldinia sp. FL1419]